MSVTVYANGQAVTHKSPGRQTAVFPDVCKTPSPGGPVPIPYPNINTNDGARTQLDTRKVKVAPQSTATKPSNVQRFMGDEAGTRKGIKSASTSGKARLYFTAMNVKTEGKNAVVIGSDYLLNAPPPVPCGNPACKYSRVRIAASLTARLPTAVKVAFPNRLVCLECYRKIVGKEPLPAGSNLAAPFIPGGRVVGAAIGG